MVIVAEPAMNKGMGKMTNIFFSCPKIVPIPIHVDRARAFDLHKRKEYTLVTSNNSLSWLLETFVQVLAS